jgi:glucosylglycerol-phosphate synthase
MILATDLDGTFLAGDAGERRSLYRLIEETPDLRLIFVTGRGAESVLPLCADPTIPNPEYIIADVGATIIHGATREPVQPVQMAIERRWPGHTAVSEVFAGFAELEMQPVAQERRCSYLLRDTRRIDAIRARANELGYDVIYSAGKYLDIMPGGVNKGASLLQLLEQLGVERSSVLVAGDTLNDLSMFETGLQGVVVGAAEPELTDKTRGMANVLHASATGCGGILEALRHFGFTSATAAAADAPIRASTAGAQLVISYHRLPFEEYTEDGVIKRRPPSSPNGIIPTLLDFFSGDRSGSWIAASVQNSRNPENFERHTTIDRARFPNLQASLIPMTARDLTLFYKTFSKEAFWPIIFSFPERVRFIDEHWRHFLEINRLFAERAAEETAAGGIVWMHDYNQWMVPGFLRQLRPDVRIAFFHHTAFPPADIFNLIPWSHEIVGSLLQCDYIGFHIPRYVANFVGVARSHGPVELSERIHCAPRFMTYGCALGIEEIVTKVRSGGRVTRLGAHPVGINVERIEAIMRTPEFLARVAELRAETDGRDVILSVERLDYVKGPLEKLNAFEHMLAEHPETHGKVVLINICTPPAPGMNVYKSIQTAVDQAVGRINGRFSRSGWTPVQYFYRALPFAEVLAYYAVAKVCWITPLRDGLNLVAKEYALAEPLRTCPGRLVLSEFAGAAVELKGAFLTNPYHQSNLSDTLFKALRCDDEEAGLRMRQIVDIVRHNDIRHWANEFMAAVELMGDD